MAFLTGDIASHGDDFRTEAPGPALGLRDERATDSRTTRIRRNYEPENFGTKAGFDKLRRVSMEPSQRNSRSPDRDNERIRRRTRHSLDTRAHDSNIARITQLPTQRSNGFRISVSSAAESESGVHVGLRDYGKCDWVSRRKE